MAEFQVGDHTYRSGKLNAMKQFHVVRKLAPVISMLGPALSGIDTSGTGLEELVQKLGPVLSALAEMSEKDCDFVIETCLAVVQRKQGEFWSAMWSQSANRLMFDDIQLPELVTIAMNVLSESLSNFFPDAQSPSLEPAFGQKTPLTGSPSRKG